MSRAGSRPYTQLSFELQSVRFGLFSVIIKTKINIVIMFFCKITNGGQTDKEAQFDYMLFDIFVRFDV